MLRLRPFELDFPRTVAEATELIARHGASAKIIAGGTDLLVNLKHELHAPERLIHLARIHSLSGIVAHNNAIELGATTTLNAIEHNASIKKYVPALALAASHVSSPQLRRMGTLGGNVMLDTRCLYYNQSAFWREALGYCLKKDGHVCHVTQTGKRCVAASSNDVATALLCFDTELELERTGQSRRVWLNDLYKGDGLANTTVLPSEVLTKVHITLPSESAPTKNLAGFAKLRHRQSIDFGLLSVAVRIGIAKEGLPIIDSARVVINAIAAKPKVFDIATVKGEVLNADSIDALGTYCAARTIPLTNICDDPSWRKAMIAPTIRRAVKWALEIP